MDNQDPHIMYKAEALELLDYKDRRSFETFCKANDISILKRSKKKYVVREEFMFKLKSDAEFEMKRKYGEDWQEGMRIASQVKIDEPQQLTHLRKNKYKPQVFEAERFAQKWSHL